MEKFSKYLLFFIFLTFNLPASALIINDRDYAFIAPTSQTWSDVFGENKVLDSGNTIYGNNDYLGYKWASSSDATILFNYLFSTAFIWEGETFGAPKSGVEFGDLFDDALAQTTLSSASGYYAFTSDQSAGFTSAYDVLYLLNWYDDSTIDSGRFHLNHTESNMFNALVIKEIPSTNEISEPSTLFLFIFSLLGTIFARKDVLSS